MMKYIICLTNVPSGGRNLFLSLDKYRNEKELKVRMEVREFINRPEMVSLKYLDMFVIQLPIQ